MKYLTIFATFLTIGCSPAAPTLEGDVRAVSVLAPQLPPCALKPAARRSLVWPGSATVLLEVNRDDATFELVDAVGLAFAFSGNSVSVHALNIESATRSLIVRAKCNDGTTSEQSFDFELHAPHWGTAIEWDAGTGPAAREHPAFFSDPGQPDTLWMLGGYGFVPQQFTVVNDLWKFDLAHSTWTAVTPTGTVPPTSAGRAVFSPDSGVFLLFGGADQNNTVPTTVTSIDTRGTVPAFSSVTATGTVHETQLEALAFDSRHNRLISYGGFDGSALVEQVQLFSLDTHAWTRTTGGGASTPDPRYGSLFGVDAIGEQLIVFSGGQFPTATDPVNPTTDTWALSFADAEPVWKLIEGATAEAKPRRNGCAAFDTQARRFYIWSGTADARTAVDQLSMLDLTETTPHWRAIPLVDPPQARGSCTGFYDGPRRRILFGFGNAGGTNFTDLQVLLLD